MTWSRRRIGVLVAAAVTQVALGCSGSGAVAVDRAAEATIAAVPTATANTDDTQPDADPTATPAATVAPTPSPTPFELGADLVERLPEGWDPVITGVSPLRPDPSAPEGGRLESRSDQTNRWSYRGVLGRLRPKQRVVLPVAARPPAVEGAAPLTGLLDAPAPDRPAVIVKIDNVPAARPQVGVNQADIVYEELVEAGVTRLAAVFHSQIPGTVGPVRSGRSTDIGIVGSFDDPLFAFSGANSIFDRLIDKQPIVNRGAEVWRGYWRNGARRAPHNLFTSIETLLDSVADGEAPRPHFAFREPDTALPSSARRADVVQLVYLAGASPAVRYQWDGAGWARWQAGTRHVDATGAQLTPANLVVQFVRYVDTGMTDKFGEDLYEGVMVGTGDALVFTAGHVIGATWTRPSLRSVTTFTDGDGNHILLTPGQTHVALVPPGGASWS